MSNSTFKCGLCKKEVISGEKFKAEISYYNDDFNLSDEILEDEICSRCSTEIENKIISLRTER